MFPDEFKKLYHNIFISSLSTRRITKKREKRSMENTKGDEDSCSE